VHDDWWLSTTSPGATVRLPVGAKASGPRRRAPGANPGPPFYYWSPTGCSAHDPRCSARPGPCLPRTGAGLGSWSSPGGRAACLADRLGASGSRGLRRAPDRGATRMCGFRGWPPTRSAVVPPPAGSCSMPAARPPPVFHHHRGVCCWPRRTLTLRGACSLLAPPLFPGPSRPGDAPQNLPQAPLKGGFGPHRSSPPSWGPARLPLRDPSPLPESAAVGTHLGGFERPLMKLPVIRRRIFESARGRAAGADRAGPRPRAHGVVLPVTRDG